MEIILINPNTSAAKGINKATIEPPLGIGYLATFLIKNGFESSVIDANILNLSNEAILERIKKDPQIIGVSFNVVSAIAAFELVKFLKAKFQNTVFIAGGPHPTSIPDMCINEFEFDVVCVGEGEETLLEIARNISTGKENPFKGVAGIYFKDSVKDEVIINPPRNLIEDLDSLPFVDFSLLPELSMYKSRSRGSPAGVILTSRGCVYQCVYCNKNIFRKTHRMRSVENVIAEIAYQIKNFHIKQLDFLDDNLTFDHAYANSLFDKIIENDFNIFINLQNGVRADLVDEGLIIKMKKSGVFKVSMGVESGDALVQKRIKKNLNLNKVLESTRLFKKHGIKVYGNFMFGLPYDTKESMRRTMDFALRMDPDIANFMIAIPLKGTELYELASRDGTILEDISKGTAFGFYGGKVYYKLEGMNAEDIISFYKRSYREFYFRPRKIIDIMRSVKSLHELRWIKDAMLEVIKSIF